MADASLTIGADGTAFTKTLQQIEKNTDKMANSVTAKLARLGQAFQGLGTITGGIKSMATTLWDLAEAVVKPAAEAETLALKFEVMLNSEAETLRFMQKLNQYAAETPFALNDISEAALTMLANTDMSTEKAMETVKAVGNISAMTGRGLKEIADLYSRAANLGVTAQIAKSFETMGVPIRKVIAEIQGISFEEVTEKISAGQITLVHLDAALKSLTSNGGKFDGATKRLSGTFSGLASTLSDNVNAALRTFGEKLLPSIQPTVAKLTELVQAATPAFERLGIMFGDGLKDVAENKALPALDELILRIPEISIQIEYAIDKMGEFYDSIMKIPHAIGGVCSAIGHAANAIHEFLFGEKGSPGEMLRRQSKDLKDRLRRRSQAADKPAPPPAPPKPAETAEQKRDRRLAEARRNSKVLIEEAEKRRQATIAEAEAHDAARAADVAAKAEAKAAADAKAKAEMAAAEEARKRAAEAKKLAEENAKAAEKYEHEKIRYEAEQERKKREKLSVFRQDQALRKEGRRLGVGGKLSPENIRARMDALAAAGAKANEKELDALQRLLEAWDALAEKKKEYTTTKRQDAMELRAGYLEATGRSRKAKELREQLEVEKRIQELRDQGASKRDATRQAVAESQLRQAQDLHERIQSARVQFIQSSLAAQGGGGTSYRLGGSQLEESKKHSRLLGEIRNYMRTLTLPKKNTAVLA